MVLGPRTQPSGKLTADDVAENKSGENAQDESIHLQPTVFFPPPI